MQLSEQEIIIKFLDYYYNSEEYPELIEFKEKMIDLTLKNLLYVKGESEEEKAVNAINNVGRAFQKVILFEFVPLTVEDIKSFLKT